MADGGLNDKFWDDEVRRFLPDPRQALEDAMKYVCCPVCYALSGVPFRYFSHLPGRWTEDALLREAVCRAGGFCSEHTWRLSEVQSLEAIAKVFVDVLDLWPSQRVAREPCPLCRLNRLMEQVLLHDLLTWLEQPWARERYGGSFGVCYRHYDALMARDLPEALRDALATVQEGWRQDLVEKLRCFLAKNTIQGKWTRTQDENRAPRRALLKTAGTAEVHRGNSSSCH